MFIGIVGSICSGKDSVARYLIEKHGFSQLHVVQEERKPGGASSSLSDQDDHENDEAMKGTGKAKLILFNSVDALLEHVTKHWRGNWVTTYIPDEKVLDQFSRRPFFLLVSIDAPTIVRWRRFQQKHGPGNAGPADKSLAAPSSYLNNLDKFRSLSISQTDSTTDSPDEYTDLSSDRRNMPLDRFTVLSDADIFDPDLGRGPLISRAAVRLINSLPDTRNLHSALDKVDLLNEDRLRPSWDSYFMSLASLAAQRSNCMKRRVGCVVVRDKRVISTGYNGTPRGLPNCAEGGCPRCNQGQGSGHGLATCLCLHAEENALLEAGRDRMHGDAVLYCDTCPCLTCSIKIVQVGIREVVYSQEYSMDGETAGVFMRAGVTFRKLVPPTSGDIHLNNLA